jgi:hypothetical protein
VAVLLGASPDKMMDIATTYLMLRSPGTKLKNIDECGSRRAPLRNCEGVDGDALRYLLSYRSSHSSRSLRSAAKSSGTTAVESIGQRLVRPFAEVGVEVAFFSYTQATSSRRPRRRTLQNNDELAEKRAVGTRVVRLAA